MIKKKIQNTYKNLLYLIFHFFYGKIEGILKLNDNKDIKEVSFNNNHKYKIYVGKNSRLYTDTVHDTAIIKKNHIIEGPSFQFRNNVMSKVENNSVFEKGTPRLKKK